MFKHSAECWSRVIKHFTSKFYRECLNYIKKYVRTSLNSLHGKNTKIHVKQGDRERENMFFEYAISYIKFSRISWLGKTYPQCINILLEILVKYYRLAASPGTPRNTNASWPNIRNLAQAVAGCSPRHAKHMACRCPTCNNCLQFRWTLAGCTYLRNNETTWMRWVSLNMEISRKCLLQWLAIILIVSFDLWSSKIILYYFISRVFKIP